MGIEDPGRDDDAIGVLEALSLIFEVRVELPLSEQFFFPGLAGCAFLRDCPYFLLTVRP